MVKVEIKADTPEEIADFIKRIGKPEPADLRDSVVEEIGRLERAERV